MIQKTRLGTDWEAELTKEEFLINEKENGEKTKTVILRGLQRLADMAGLTECNCTFNYVPVGEFGLVQCIYTAAFSDGTKWVGAADCNQRNTDVDYLRYPTSVAESRAEARCLKKALGIRLLSAEEVGFQSEKEVQPEQPISDNVIKVIEKLCEEKSIGVADMLEQIIEDKQRARSIYELKQLTLVEGQKAMEFLNSTQKAKKEKVDAKTERENRKKELLAKTNKNNVENQ